MNLWVFILGLLIVATVLADAAITASSATGNGPVTRWVAPQLGRFFRLAARWQPALLRAAGPAVMFATLCMWLGGAWVGWWVVFSARPAAVVRAGTMAIAGAAERLYFVGSTVFTLGIGDFVPAGGLWQVLAGLASMNGLLVFIMAVAFFVAASQANGRRRTHARVLNDLGRDVQAILIRAWDGHSFEQLAAHLRPLAELVTETWQDHRAYPFLRFMQPRSRSTSLEANIAVLDEALLVLEHGIDERFRPHPMVTAPLRGSLNRLVDTLASEPGGSPSEIPAPPALDSLRRVGIPTVTDESFGRAVATRRDHRQRLARLVTETPWNWDEGVETSEAGGASGSAR